MAESVQGVCQSTLLPTLYDSLAKHENARALSWIVPVSTEDRFEWHTVEWSFKDVFCRAQKASIVLRRDLADEARIGVAISEGPALPLLELAILLSGLTIVPLDACDPCARLACILEEAELAVVVVQDAPAAEGIHRAVVAAFTDGGPRVMLETDLVDLTMDAPECTVGVSSITRSSTSHIFFTSGSTGRPKGCVVSHGALANYCSARNMAHSVDHESVCFVASAHTFDPSLGDLMATLLAGGRVVYAPRHLLLPQLGALLLESRATHICCTPTLFATLRGTRFEQPGELPHLQVVALGDRKSVV